MAGLQLASPRAQAWVVMGLLALERAASQLWGLDLLDGANAAGGMLAALLIGHCDTMSGPVIGLARRALAERNVNLVLPWVRKEDEAHIRHAFDHAQAVRGLGAQAQALADQYFFETLVRIHRAGEGAPYTGLKPADTDLGPAVPAADQALQSGSPDQLIQLLVNAVSEGVRHRFAAAFAKKNFDANDVGAGREYVEAYVSYVHQVEKIWEAACMRKAASQCGGEHRAAGEHHHH